MRSPWSRVLRRLAWYSTVASGSLLGTTTNPAFAEPPPARLAGIPAPGRSLASNDQSSAIATNPANVALLPGPELRWTWVRTNPGSADNLGSPDPGRGHAFDLAASFFDRVGTGVRLDLVRPAPAATPVNHHFTWLTWALAVRLNDAISVGGSVAHAYSDVPLLSGATTLTAALSVRPSPYFGLAIVGRNLNGPHTTGGLRVDPQVDVAFAIRPTGRRDVEIGLEDRYVDGSGQWLPRATLGIDVPYVGRLRGEVALSDPTTTGPLLYTATAGLEVGWTTTTLGSAASNVADPFKRGTVEGGAVFGSMIDGSNGAGFYTGAALTGYRNPGPPSSSYALRIRIESTPSVRGHVHLLQRLWKLAEDRELRAVALVLKSEPASSLPHAEELGDAVRMLRANGKRVICHLEDAQSRSLYVCSQADRIVINPSGGIRFAGLRAQYMYYAALLEKLGIQAQIVRIGAHKSAPESFLRNSASDVARADHVDLLNEVNQVLLSDVGGGRKIPMATLAERIAHGPFLAKEAKEAGLVDGEAFDDEVDDVVSEVVGRRVPLRDEPPAPAVPERFGMQRGVAMVYVDGDMIDGRSRNIPVIGTRLVGSYTIAQSLKEARENPRIGAVVMRIESPGGSSLASDVIWREARLTSKVKPLIVSMGSSAASGGYYIATAGTSIWANPLTVTGSIGIFYGKADVSGLLRKIGVSIETYKTTPRADSESFYRPYTANEIAELERKVAQWYDQFVSRVAEGRHLTKAQVDEVGQGRVWSGRQAYERRLVDHLGGIREALDEARRLAGLPRDAPIHELPATQTSLIEFAAKLAGLGQAEEPAIPIPSQLVDVVQALAPFAIYDSTEALARMELVPLSAP